MESETDERTMQGKTAMVTGASTGIGKETARALAGMGARVVMVSRDRARGEAALDEVRAESAKGEVELMLADLSTQREVRRLAREAEAGHERLEVLINNAGGTFNERESTEDGLERTFALNHLAPFLLTNLLLDVLKKSAPARVVNVASGAHAMGRIDFDDLQGEGRYSPSRSYAQAKLADVMFTYELARRLEGTGVTANTAHPGFVATNFYDRSKGLARLVVDYAVRPTVMVPPEKGAETVVHLASSPELEGVTGGYFAKKEPKASSKRSKDREAARRLWEASEELVRRSDPKGG